MSSHFISPITRLNFKYVLDHSFIPRLLNAFYVLGTVVEIVIVHYLIPEAAQGGLVRPLNHILISPIGVFISFSFLCFYQEKYVLFFPLYLDPWALITARGPTISL